MFYVQGLLKMIWINYSLGKVNKDVINFSKIRKHSLVNILIALGDIYVKKIMKFSVIVKFRNT